ncbi:peptidoglycan-binding domain-containing protein [Candidatus Electronema sp. TJ]|uniref:peptidoglycan-binding domain-containing protein n=1 Tax=Candidatus Electronema sp. TJ TaxID=3401573 RepID=UPI003AA9394A
MKNLLAYAPDPFDNLEAEFGEMEESESGRRSRRSLRKGIRRPPSYLRKPRPHWQRRDYAPRLPTIPLWLPDAAAADDDDNGDDCIRWVQDCLNRVMELQLPLDGFANRETKSALREFQRRYGLPVSGVVEVETEAELIVQSIGSLMEAEEDLFLGKAVRGISRAASRAAKTVSRAARDVSKVAAQGVKFAGKAYKTASSLTQPIGPKLLTRFGKDVLSGKNVVKSFRSTVKSGLDDVRNRIKYVQMAASFVPGIGTGVSAALGAANALASGRPITAALIEAARGAIPGGPLAQTAFDMGMNLARGQNISTAALNAAKNRIPPAARAAFDTAVALGRGQSLQQAALGAVRNRLPVGGRAVFDTALAVGRGQNLQQAVLANAGRMIHKSPYANRALAAARYADAQSRRFRKFEGEAEQAHSSFCLCPSCCGNEAEELAFAGSSENELRDARGRFIADPNKPPSSRSKHKSPEYQQARADLKRSTIDNPDAPRWMRGWFKNEQRQRGDNARNWRNPSGYDTGHLDPRDNTRLRWEKASDNRSRGAKFKREL